MPILITSLLVAKMFFVLLLYTLFNAYGFFCLSLSKIASTVFSALNLLISLKSCDVLNDIRNLLLIGFVLLVLMANGYLNLTSRVSLYSSGSFLDGRYILKFLNPPKLDLLLLVEATP